MEIIEFRMLNCFRAHIPNVCYMYVYEKLSKGENHYENSMNLYLIYDEYHQSLFTETYFSCFQNFPEVILWLHRTSAMLQQVSLHEQSNSRPSLSSSCYLSTATSEFSSTRLRVNGLFFVQSLIRPEYPSEMKKTSFDDALSERSEDSLVLITSIVKASSELHTTAHRKYPSLLYRKFSLVHSTTQL